MSAYRGRGGGPADSDYQADRRGRRDQRQTPYGRPEEFRQGGGRGRGGPGGYRGGGGGGNGGGGWSGDRRQRGRGFQPGGPPMQPRVDPSSAAREDKIDRTKICPLLLRVYIQKDKHHTAEQFAVRGEEPNEDSIIIYTWPDASLRELAELIQLVNADARRPQTDLSFGFVYPDRTGTNVIKHVQTIPAFRSSKTTTAQRGRAQDDEKTLKQLRFETGDFLSVALMG